MEFPMKKLAASLSLAFLITASVIAGDLETGPSPADPAPTPTPLAADTPSAEGDLETGPLVTLIGTIISVLP